MPLCDTVPLRDNASRDTVPLWDTDWSRKPQLAMLYRSGWALSVLEYSSTALPSSVEAVPELPGRHWATRHRWG